MPEGERDGRARRRIGKVTLLVALVGTILAAAVGLALAAIVGAPGSDDGRSPSAVAASGRAASVNVGRPAISGLALVGQRLQASPGRWSPRPSSYRYRWLRCNASGGRCKPIASAASSRYRVSGKDLGRTLRVSVTASVRGRRSRAALSAHTHVVTRAPVVPAPAPAPTGVRHLEYVFNDGPVNVFDIDNGFRLVETFTLPGTDRGVRGVAVSPATHMMFVSYGGDGGGNGNGSVLAYDLVSKRVVWSVNLGTGIDSGAVSPDGKLLYMPDGENSPDGNWYVIDTSNGNVVGKIETPGAGPHDGVMSADGKILLLGDRNYSRLSIYNTQTGKLQASVGPLVGGVRPNTVNGSDTVSFTTATGFDGFQVGSITGANVLYTESFGSCSGPFTTCSHGVSLSPDNRLLYVIDTVHKQVQAWDVHGVAAGVAPVHVANVPVDGLEGDEKGCAYDCGRDGWLQYSLDGRYVFVGDSGDVIETATQRVVAKIESLLNSRKSVEIDFSGGVPTASSGRQGVGLQP